MTELQTIGHALMDVMAKVEEGELQKFGYAKGHMHLLSEDAVHEVLAHLTPVEQAAGGSAGNTATGFAQLGGDVTFCGCVGEDAMGRAFVQSLQQSGVEFTGATVPGRTGMSLVLVTPDGERTMLTALGIAGTLSPDHLSKGAPWLYLEGYLFDSAQGKAAFHQAVTTTRDAGGKVALSLSDSFCVTRHRQDFMALIEEGVDVVFGNSQEFHDLTALDSCEHLPTALPGVSTLCYTCGGAGSHIFHEGRWHTIPAQVCGPVFDTTGAGDQYAAGVLFGLTRARAAEACGALGSRMAGQVITRHGPRLHHHELV